MRISARTPFTAIFQIELLLNSKRAAPYALMILFIANAILWWGKGAAVYYGWATNSDFYIARNLTGFSFLTLPLFTALMMGDPVIRDFRAGVDPLIFSKPVGRAQYLLGKFFGNFFVLVCCQAVFMLTLLLLQAFRPEQMIVQPASVFPYFKHFFFLVVISHLALAAVCFTVGTLTRNAKIVYLLAASFYPLYIAYQIFVLKPMSSRWRVSLDPLLFNWTGEASRGQSAEWLNQLSVSYNADMIANRVLLILLSAICLTILYARFSWVERYKSSKADAHASILNLATRTERLYNDTEHLTRAQLGWTEKITAKSVTIPKVRTTTEGRGANFKQFIAASIVELRLLRAERSLVVVMPLVVLLCNLDVTYIQELSDVSYSAEYASGIANSLLLFLFAIAVFYTGEAMHRDRELRFEPLLWTTPAPNSVLLLSKFAAVFLLSLTLVILAALVSIALQAYKGHAPVDVLPYLITMSVILVPSIVFMISVAIALNVLLRDKYLAYAAGIGIGGGLYYLFSYGYNDWLYNPVLYRLWTYSDLTGAQSGQSRILIHRVYCLAIATVFLSLAHLVFERKLTRGFYVSGRLSSTGWTVLIMIASAAIAILTGLILARVY